MQHSRVYVLLTLIKCFYSSDVLHKLLFNNFYEKSAFKINGNNAGIILLLKKVSFPYFIRVTFDGKSPINHSFHASYVDSCFVVICHHLYLHHIANLHYINLINNNNNNCVPGILDI